MRAVSISAILSSSSTKIEDRSEFPEDQGSMAEMFGDIVAIKALAEAKAKHTCPNLGCKWPYVISSAI